MVPKYDALDRLILSFEDSDPVEEIKEALAANNIKEASAKIDGLTPEQLDKLAELIPGLVPEEQNTSTVEDGVDVDDSSKPEPKDSHNVDADKAEPANTTGDEKVDNTSSGVGKDGPGLGKKDEKVAAIYRGIRSALKKTASLAIKKNKKNEKNYDKLLDKAAYELAQKLLDGTLDGTKEKTQER